MSLESLLKELDSKKRMDQERKISILKEQHAADIKAKDQEIAALKDELETMRCWLDKSALPAANPIKKRMDSMGLVKMNFSDDKPCPEFWQQGEKELLDSVKREKLLEGEPASSRDELSLLLTEPETENESQKIPRFVPSKTDDIDYGGSEVDDGNSIPELPEIPKAPKRPKTLTSEKKAAKKKTRKKN